MSLKRNILIGSLIAVPVLAAAYYRYILSSYDYNVSSITPVSIDGANSVIKITIDVTSKIGIGLTIKDIYVDVYIEGYKVGNVVESQPVVIPNFGSAQIVLLANVDLTQVANDVTGILVDVLSSGSSNVTIVGYTHVQVGVMPFTSNVVLKQGYTMKI